MDLLRRLFRHSPKRYLTALALAALLTGLRLWSLGGLLPLFWADALETAGGVLILLGLLSLAARLGAFDTVGYAFSTFRSQRRYKDLYEYSVAKKENRSRQPWGFMAFIAVGVLFLAAGLILSAAVRQSI